MKPNPKHAGGAPKILDGNLVLIAFKADTPTANALNKLCALETDGDKARSRVIRRAIAHELARVVGKET